MFILKDIVKFVIRNSIYSVLFTDKGEKVYRYHNKAYRKDILRLKKGVRGDNNK